MLEYSDEDPSRLLQGIDRLTRVLNGTNVIEDDHSQFSALHDPFLPTHILALCDQSPSDTSHTRPIILQPTHRTVLASQCTNLPELSDELSFSPAYPVVYAIPLHLPYPTVFEPLHRYLYDHDGTKLLRFFLPLEWRLRRPQNADIERRHWDSLKHSPSSLVTLLRTRKALISGFSRLLAFKQNVTALGIHDKNLWRVMSTASYLLRSALDSFISS